MKGAFNDIALTCAPYANVNDVIQRLDHIINRYGSFGAYGRKDQMSHRFLNEEFKQLEIFSFIFPTIFIAVAAFLLNVVISRTVKTQREQVAILKAFGYGNFEIGLHYFKFVVFTVIFGVAGGTAAGVWLGRMLGDLYMEFYRFPSLQYRLDPMNFAGRRRYQLGRRPGRHGPCHPHGRQTAARRGHASRTAGEVS